MFIYLLAQLVELLCLAYCGYHSGTAQEVRWILRKIVNIENVVLELVFIDGLCFAIVELNEVVF